MLWFFLFMIWIWLLITIFVDIFRSPMSGWAKAGWIDLHHHPAVPRRVHLSDCQRRQDAGAVDGISRRGAAGTGQLHQECCWNRNTTDQLKTLSDLHDAGKLTDDDTTPRRRSSSAESIKSIELIEGPGSTRSLSRLTLTKVVRLRLAHEHQQLTTTASSGFVPSGRFARIL